MKRPEVSTSQIVRWEILKGLPGDGPIPKYFHLGHPTPWSEGLVVKFSHADGTSWAGNFQRSAYSRRTEVLLWPEADSVIVIASGAFYLIDASNPDKYSTVRLVTQALLDPQRTMLFVAETLRISAFDRNRRVAWVRQRAGEYHPELTSCVGGILTVEVEVEMGEPGKIVRVSAADGTNL